MLSSRHVMKVWEHVLLKFHTHVLIQQWLIYMMATNSMFGTSALV
jgi:hypothetical protein